MKLIFCGVAVGLLGCGADTLSATNAGGLAFSQDGDDAADLGTDADTGANSGADSAAGTGPHGNIDGGDSGPSAPPSANPDATVTPQAVPSCGFGAMVAVDPSVDVSGVWAAAEVRSELSIVPVVGRVVNQDVNIYRVVVSQDGASLNVSKSVCHMQRRTDTTVVSTVYPSALLSNHPTVERQGWLVGAGGGQVHYCEDEGATMLGLNLDDPLNDPLPNSADDPRVFDMDNDGRPGVTVRVSGLINGEVYFASRMKNTSIGTTPLGTDVSRISGQVRWSIETLMLGADNSVLARPNPTYDDPEPANSFFEMIRIDPSVGCAQLAEEYGTLFDVPLPG